MKVQTFVFYYAGYFLVLYLLLLIADKAGIMNSDALHEEYRVSEMYVPFAPMNRSQTAEDQFAEGADFGAESPSDATARKGRTACLALGLLAAQDRARYEQYTASEKEDEFQQRESSFVVHLVQRRKTKIEDISLDAVYGSDNSGDIEMSDNPMHKSPLSRSSSRPPNLIDRGSSFMFKSRQKKYSREFQEYLALQRCRLGCGDVLYQGGYTVPLLGWRLPPGRAEEFWLYMYNNHTILSCISCAKESDQNRGSRRVVLIISNAVSFFMSALTAVFFRTIGVGPQYSQATEDDSTAFLVQQITDMIFIAPATLLIAQFCTNVYRCNFAFAGKDNKSPRAVRLRYIAGLLSTGVLFFGSLVLLCVCAVLTTGEGWKENVWQFTAQVLLVTNVLDLLFAVLNFASEYHFSVHLLYDYLCVISVGRYYLETLVIEGRIEYNDYYDLSRSYFGGLLRVDRVLPKEYAERKGWVKVRVKSYVFSEVNPMLEARTLPALKQRQSLVLERESMSSPLRTSTIIYSPEIELTDRESVSRDSRYKMERLPDTANPLHRKTRQRTVHDRPMMGILSPEALTAHLLTLSKRQHVKEGAVEELEFEDAEQAAEGYAVQHADGGSDEHEQHAEQPAEVDAEQHADGGYDESSSHETQWYSQAHAGAEHLAEEPTADEHFPETAQGGDEHAGEEIQWYTQEHTQGYQVSAAAAVASQESPPPRRQSLTRAVSIVDEEQWEMLYSQSHARHYWRNKVTLEKTWKNPLRSAPVAAVQEQQEVRKVEVQTASMDIAGTRNVWKERARRASMAPADMVHAAAAAMAVAQRPEELAQTDVQSTARVWTERVRRASILAPAAVPMPQQERGQHHSDIQERKL